MTLSVISEKIVKNSKMGHPFRVIARLDVKGQNVVKGIHLEGLRIVGTPGKT